MGTYYGPPFYHSPRASEEEADAQVREDLEFLLDNDDQLQPESFDNPFFAAATRASLLDSMMENSHSSAPAA